MSVLHSAKKQDHSTRKEINRRSRMIAETQESCQRATDARILMRKKPSMLERLH